MTAEETIAARLREQASWCRSLRSRLYDTLLETAANDVIAHGPAWEVLQGREVDPSDSALALRLMGGMHRLVLSGEVPEMARFYPSVGGDGDPTQAWPAFREVLVAKRDALRALVLRPVQTNEVGRSAALIGGFLEVARATKLPLSLVELGASAGLNLRWDHYRYETPDATWGAPSSVHFVKLWEGTPPFSVQVRVVARVGCDPAPLDPSREEDRLTLASYVWADQIDRLVKLRAACALAATVPAPVEKSGAAAFLEAHLAARRNDVATVIFHSVVMQYLPPDERARVVTLLTNAGKSTTAPLAWLRMEPVLTEGRMVRGMEVRLTLWPNGEDRLIAIADGHARHVEWLLR